MRRMVFATVLVGATGCNWALGLNQTQTWDAGDGGADAPDPSTAFLQWGAVTTDGMGTPDPTIVYAGIGSETLRPETPVIEVGPLDASMGPLVASSYSADPGTLQIPYILLGTPIRIVYTLPGDPVPHEMQRAEPGAHLVVPRYTRMNAPLVPPASGFSITPIGIPAFSGPMIFTSGVFNRNDVSVELETSNGDKTVTLRYPEKARPLSLPTGAFESAQRDWVLASSWVPRAGGESSIAGWAIARNIDLAPQQISLPIMQPTYTTGDRNLGSGPGCPGVNCWPTFQAGNAESRMGAALGPLITTATRTRNLRYGVIPSAEVAPYSRGVAPDYVDTSSLLYFAEAVDMVTGITVGDPSSELGLPRAVNARLTASRTVMGATLVSSMQQMELEPFSTTSVVRWNAPLATAITLGGTSLSGADDAQIPGSANQLTLKFTPDNTNANDFAITLYELASSKITPVRIYHVTQPEALIDGSLLVAGHRYVLGITSRTGLPMAFAGDYRVVTFPFATSTTMAATFVIQ